MFFVGRNFVSGVICTRNLKKPLKTLKTYKPKNFFQKTYRFFGSIQPWFFPAQSASAFWYILGDYVKN